MKERSVKHDTFVIERRYPAAPERVFGAFSDPAKKRRWFGEGEEARLESFEMDFRVGGGECSRFRFGQETVCTNQTVYLDIQPGRRIVLAYTMSLGDRRISSSQATFEFEPAGSGTDLIFTEQGAYFEGADGPEIRADGWRLLLGRLEGELAG